MQRESSVPVPPTHPSERQDETQVRHWLPDEHGKPTLAEFLAEILGPPTVVIDNATGEELSGAPEGYPDGPFYLWDA